MKWVALVLLLAGSCSTVRAIDSPFRLHWEDDILTISADELPGGHLKIWYLEAYCRPGSTTADWHDTVIGHETTLVSADDTDQKIQLECVLKDGVRVAHTITATPTGVAFDLVATNRTSTVSQAHWAQPCIRVGEFTGSDQEGYLAKSFIFLDGKPAFLPTKNWATKARYVPGQVWCPRGVNRNDVNPRPLSDDVPSNGLIGCFSADDRWIMATAWEPYQELFQGIIVCLHSDFRIGGLQPGETKKIHGRVYLLKGTADDLLQHYRNDFPAQSVARRAPSPPFLTRTRK